MNLFVGRELQQCYTLSFSMGLQWVTECLRLSPNTGFDWLSVKLILGMLLVYLCIAYILEMWSLSICIQVNVQASRPTQFLPVGDGLCDRERVRVWVCVLTQTCFRSLLLKALSNWTINYLWIFFFHRTTIISLCIFTNVTKAETKWIKSQDDSLFFSRWWLHFLCKYSLHVAC